MPLLTIGHSTRTVETLIALLGEAAVDLVLDVRSYPRSRRNPQFNADSLPGALAAAAIDYRHLPALGGRRGRQAIGRDSPNGFWQVEGFRNYADYALTPPFRAALAEVIALTETRRPAVMCAEALWSQCHRRIIADYALAAGVEVRHIVDAGRIEAARLTAEATPQPDGSLHYPAAQGSLF